MNLVGTLQSALAVEHQAVYAYGVVGARLANASLADASSCLLRHQQLRDRVAQLIAARGAVPVPAEPAYALPFAVGDALAAATLASRLEDATSAAAWDVLVATSIADRHERQTFIGSLSASAEWSGRWRERAGAAAVPALPGQPPSSQPSTTPTSSPS